MSEASFASLGPTLLARKGGAKPAMRPQLAPLPGVVPPEADQLEDLGWNDMGQDGFDAPVTNDNIVSIIPGAEPDMIESVPQSPLVHRQQRRIAEHIRDEQIPADTAPVPTSQKRSRTKASKTASTATTARRAAFTLRLDTDRHLKLRLAATMQGVSAQALVTQALDEMLAEIDDLDSLAADMTEHMKRN